jgi:D-xylose transport system substrate-binding protein
MRTTIVTFILLIGIVLGGCIPKHPKIGLLVHSFDVPRWQNDQNYFIAAVNKLGGVPLVKLADNNSDTQLQQAKDLINEGAAVLVVIPVDQYAAAKIVEMAHERNVKVIAYDRLVNNCDLDYYVSTDNVRVGEIQAQYITNLKPVGNYALLGGPLYDNNSRMIYLGQMNIIQPFVERAEINIVFRQFGKYWTVEEGHRLAIAALDSASNKMDAIICGNDAMAMGAIKALQERNLIGQVAVAGQDADPANIEQIIKGHQAMTVYKRFRTMATTAAELALQLAQNKPTEPYLTTISNGQRLVPSYLIDASLVNEGNIEMSVPAEN